MTTIQSKTFTQLVKMVVNGNYYNLATKQKNKSKKVIMTPAEWNDFLESDIRRSLADFCIIQVWQNLTFREFKKELKSHTCEIVRTKTQYGDITGKAVEAMKLPDDAIVGFLREAKASEKFSRYPLNLNNPILKEMQPLLHVKFEYRAKNRLAVWLAKNLGLKQETIMTLLQNQAFNGLCKYYAKKPKECREAICSLSIDSDDIYDIFTIKVNTATFEIHTINAEKKKAADELLKKEFMRQENERLMVEIESKNELINEVEYMKRRLEEVKNGLSINGDKMINDIMQDIEKSNRYKISLKKNKTITEFYLYDVLYLKKPNSLIRTVNGFDTHKNLCNKYHDLKVDTPEFFDEAVFERGMVSYQEYKGEFDKTLKQVRAETMKLEKHINKIVEDGNINDKITNFTKQQNKTKKVA